MFWRTVQEIRVDELNVWNRHDRQLSSLPTKNYEIHNIYPVFHNHAIFEEYIVSNVMKTSKIFQVRARTYMTRESGHTHYSLILTVIVHELTHTMLTTKICVLCYLLIFFNTLKCRHNERDSVSNHQPRDCLLNHLFRHSSKKISKLRVTGLCQGNSPVTG